MTTLTVVTASVDPNKGVIVPLVTGYVTTILAVILISVRLIWRHRRGERMYPDDIWMGVSLGPLLVRLGLVHIVLKYGTNNINYDNIGGMSPAQIQQRVIGSKLILLSRISYAGL